MAVGLSTVNLANKWLNLLRGTAFTAPTAIYAQLHVGDPGASGTANASANTTRVAVTFNAAASGAITISNSPGWSMAATETISHISLWDASTAGNFLWSAAGSASKGVTSGDFISLTACGLTLAALAA